MLTFNVIRKSDSQMGYQYTADSALDLVGFEFTNYYHVIDETPAPIEVKEASEWIIWVGSFFDRFGDYKIPILASIDPVIQAIIKDASVRRYIDLLGRKGELTLALSLLKSKGYTLDVDAILNTKPTPDEIWQ